MQSQGDMKRPWWKLEVRATRDGHDYIPCPKANLVNFLTPMTRGHCDPFPSQAGGCTLPSSLQKPHFSVPPRESSSQFPLGARNGADMSSEWWFGSPGPLPSPCCVSWSFSTIFSLGVSTGCRFTLATQSPISPVT